MLVKFLLEKMFVEMFYLDGSNLRRITLACSTQILSVHMFISMKRHTSESFTI